MYMCSLNAWRYGGQQGSVVVQSWSFQPSSAFRCSSFTACQSQLSERLFNWFCIIFQPMRKLTRRILNDWRTELFPSIRNFLISVFQNNKLSSVYSSPSSWSEESPGSAGGLPSGGFWPASSRGERRSARGSGLWRRDPLGLSPDEWSCGGGCSCCGLRTVPCGEAGSLQIICLCGVTVICGASAYKAVRKGKNIDIYRGHEHFKGKAAAVWFILKNLTVYDLGS